MTGLLGPDTLFDDEPGPVGRSPGTTRGSAGPGAPDDDTVHPGAPLAVRMRPRDLGEVLGQDHLLGPGAPLRMLVDGGGRVSLVLVGPPGTGKTTLARLVARAGRHRWAEVSAVSGGVREVRAAVEAARDALARSGRRTVLFVDEVHRFSRTQQDALLPGVENGWVTLIAATTENPFVSVVSPLLSRCLLLTLRPLDDDAVAALVDRAIGDDRGLAGRVALTPDALAHLVRLSGGDARRALTALEAAVPADLGGSPAADPGAAEPGRSGAAAEGSAASEGSGSGGTAPASPVVLDVEAIQRAVDTAAVRYDRAGDQHYDVTSALIKSIRGSDVDAALHWLARMLVAGEDPRFVARRLIILAGEDIGLADPSALATAVAAAGAVERVGLPEGRFALAQAVIALSLAPKSNSVLRALDAATADVLAGRGGPVPLHLRDAHHPGSVRLGHGVGYVYPHDLPEGVAAQRHIPDDLRDAVYYRPGARGAEVRLGEIARRLDAAVRGGGSGTGGSGTGGSGTGGSGPGGSARGRPAP